MDTANLFLPPISPMRAAFRKVLTDRADAASVCKDILNGVLGTHHVFNGVWVNEEDRRKFTKLRFAGRIDGLGPALVISTAVPITYFFEDLANKVFPVAEEEELVRFMMSQPAFSSALASIKKDRRAAFDEKMKELRSYRDKARSRLKGSFKPSVPPDLDPDDKTPASFSLDIFFHDGGRFLHESGVTFSVKKVHGTEPAIIVAKCPEGHELCQAQKKSAYALVRFLFKEANDEPIEQEGKAWQERMILRQWLRVEALKLHPKVFGEAV